MIPLRHPGWVYFVQRADGEGPIKIGYSQQPQTRFQTIDCASPVPMQVLALLPGPFELEQRVHARFLGQHIRYEWFKATPDLLGVVESVRSGTFDSQTLPPPTRKLFAAKLPRGTRPTQMPNVPGLPKPKS